MRILIAEDETEIARGLKYLLEKNNFTVDVVANGIEAVDYFSSREYDAVVLDIMMPGLDGISVLKRIRNSGSSVPIMMMTAKSDIDDRVLGLDAGADDYLPKPFATREFIARVKALVRRSPSYTPDTLSFGNLTLDCNKYILSSSMGSVSVNNKEFQLMELFMNNPGIIFSSSRLMDKIWKDESTSNIDVIWTHIGFLRKKIKQIGGNIEIKNIRGAGYILEAV